MYLPSAALANKLRIDQAVAEVARQMAPDVAYIRYEIGWDWSGDPAIYFRVVLSDAAADKRLREAATQVVRRLDERLDFQSMGLYPYHHFRSVSEQADLREEAWA
jgi:DNA-directed RNA polymerase subunit L